MQRQASGTSGPATGSAAKSTVPPVPAEANLSLTALRYIVAVDTHHNFVRAAEACGVTQPTLSAGIRSIETALDVSIFDRGAHPVRPTALGEKIIAQARVTLHNASQLRELVAAEKGDESGEAVIGIIPTIAPYILPVSEMRTRFIIEKLLAAEIDMAILATPLEQKGLLEIPLYYEKFTAYISPSDELYALSEIPADSLASDRLWILEEGHCLRSQVAASTRSCESWTPTEATPSFPNCTPHSSPRNSAGTSALSSESPAPPAPRTALPASPSAKSPLSSGRTTSASGCLTSSPAASSTLSRKRCSTPVSSGSRSSFNPHISHLSPKKPQYINSLSISLRTA